MGFCVSLEQVQDLKSENTRLKEIQGRRLLSIKDQDDTGNDQNSSISYGLPSWKSGYSGITSCEAEVLGQIHPSTHGITSRNSNVDEVVNQQRDTALWQSLFSAILSLLVGMIIWEAEDPCMPLVVALYTVVGMSLTSVVQFFSTIKNKPASDAVALLSFNWFVVGTLTYPTLPKVARTIAPLALSFMDQALNWLGLSSK